VSIVDDRGRVFGRWNIVDTVVVCAAVGVIVMGYGAFLLFRTPAPTLVSVTPAQIVSQESRTLYISGEKLRPYLNVRVGMAIAPLLLEGPSTAQVTLPGLSEGAYDIVLLDESQELARLVGALIVEPLQTRYASVQVKFVMSPDVAALVNPGDVDSGLSMVDAGTPPGGEIPQGTIVSIDTDRENVVGAGGLGIAETVVVFDATVRVPVVMAPDGWRYSGRPVMVGASFRFEGRSYAIDGRVRAVRIEEATNTAQ